MSQTAVGRLRRLLTGGLVIAVAMAVMNVATYGFTIVAARVLGPVDYGALAAIMGLLLVLNVLSLGLQATAARRVAAAPAGRGDIGHDVMHTTYRCAMVLGALSLSAAPFLAAVLNLDSWTAVALVALTVVPVTVMGGQAGILQGERRWGSLAAIYLAAGVGRVAFGALGLLVQPDSVGAMTGVTVGAFVPALIGGWALRRSVADLPGSTSGSSPTDGSHSRSLLAETFHNSHALLAFFALSSIDVVLARIVLDEHQAGLYAGGLILVKAVLFLPQFVVVVVFPSMSSQQSARRMNLQALALVLAIGLATVAGVSLLPGPALAFVGGAAYAEISGLLWLFALLGTLLAMLQLMVYNVVARQRQRAVPAVWLALLVVAAVATLATDVSALVQLVLAVDAVLLGVLLTGAARRPPTAVPARPVDVEDRL